MVNWMILMGIFDAKMFQDLPKKGIVMKKALIIGIDHYTHFEKSNLSGCVNDAEKVELLLSRNAVCNKEDEVNFECKLLTSRKLQDKEEGISRAYVQKHIKELFEDEEADVALLYFSGHGFESSLGGYLVTQDAKQYEEGVSVHDVMTYANNSTIKEIIIILDCCFAGNMGEFAVLKSGNALLRKGISILTSSGSHEVSLESRNGHGVFTQMICDVLESGGDLLGNVKVSHLYEHTDELLRAWEQRPYCKMNVSRLSTLRKNKPKIERTILRNLRKYFNAKNELQFQPTPEYEDTSKTADPEKVKVFKELQKCFYQGLVVPVDAPNMYDVAMNSKTCKLTGMGMFYRSLVVKNAI